MNAQGQNVKIYSVDEDGNKVEVPKYDALKHSLELGYKINANQKSMFKLLVKLATRLAKMQSRRD